MIIFFLITSFLVQSCKEKVSNKKNGNSTSISIEVDTKKAVLKDSKNKNDKYFLNIEEIDSLQYFKKNFENSFVDEDLIKIKNFHEAKKMLEGIVVFNEKDVEYPLVVSIYDRNGKEIIVNDDFFFKAYYPKDDILLCEGGHSIDVSFNLNNGKSTEEIGNPDLIRTSVNKKYRLNGYFGGQECYSYFIQRNVNNEFKKVIQLDEEFENLTNKWLCRIGDVFWINENTLYLTEASIGEKVRYFSIEITES